MHSIRTKILLFTLIPLLVTLLIIGLVAVLDKQESERSLIINRLDSYRSLLESGTLSFESLKDVAKLEELINEKVEHAEILKKDAVLYSTQSIPPAERNAVIAPSIDEAFTGIETILHLNENGRPILVYISPLIVNNKIVGVVRIDLSNEQTQKRVTDFLLFVIFIVAASLLICYFLIAILLTNTVLRNIKNLTDSAELLEEGDLNKPIVAQSNDEIGELAETLERMREEVKNSRQSLEDANKDLEKQVADRTVELQSKFDELEHLNRFMIDREIKMVELKEQIAHLKNSGSH
jgi:nitrate/nitrite-specific signal transduction histidine kinase